MDAATVFEALDNIGKIAGALKDKYGIIHKQAFIKYKGKEGRLVWDYIILNELTFEDQETGEQHSLGMSASDKKTEEIFNALVEKYGI